MRPIRQLFSPLADNFLQVWSAQSSSTNAHSNDSSPLRLARISQSESVSSSEGKNTSRSIKSTSGYEKLYTKYNQENSKS